MQTGLQHKSAVLCGLSITTEYSLLGMYNEMAYPVSPQIKKSYFPNIFKSILIARQKTTCTFETAGFPEHHSPSTCLGIEIQPRYSAAVRNDKEARKERS